MAAGLALALAVAAGARAAGSASIAASVVATPLAVGLSLAPTAVPAGTSATATATVRNLGVVPLADVSVSLRADPTLTIAGATRTIASLGGRASAQLAWPVCSGGAGSFLLLARASSGGYRADSPAQLLRVGSGSATCPKSASGTVAAGQTLTTDVEGDGATATGPLETAVTPSAAGFVSIQETAGAQPAASGLVSIPWQVQIAAPVGSPSQPIQIAFALDASLIPAGVAPLSLQVRRDGLVVPACPADPCLAARAVAPDGDLLLTVRTSAASLWTFGTIYPFVGFLAPLANPPALNDVQAGTSVVAPFALGGFRGWGILAAGFPTSRRIDCKTGAPSGAAASTSGVLLFGVGAYAYVWKTDRAWAGTCRELLVRLADGTDHYARFRLR